MKSNIYRALFASAAIAVVAIAQNGCASKPKPQIRLAIRALPEDLAQSNRCATINTIDGQSVDQTIAFQTLRPGVHDIGYTAFFVGGAGDALFVLDDRHLKYSFVPGPKYYRINADPIKRTCTIEPR